MDPDVTAHLRQLAAEVRDDMGTLQSQINDLSAGISALVLAINRMVIDEDVSNRSYVRARLTDVKALLDRARRRARQ
ncbi:MAG: hypothetical protein KY469_10865 [Actinobacteria bacterium]|nr:hypothetical protein [Actinomycetota bacterium]